MYEKSFHLQDPKTLNEVMKKSGRGGIGLLSVSGTLNRRGRKVYRLGMTWILNGVITKARGALSHPDYDKISSSRQYILYDPSVDETRFLYRLSI